MVDDQSLFFLYDGVEDMQKQILVGVAKTVGVLIFCRLPVLPYGKLLIVEFYVWDPFMCFWYLTLRVSLYVGFILAFVCGTPVP